MRCPYCPQEPETDLKYCRKCGMPTVSPPQQSVKESTTKQKVMDEPSASTFTARIGTLDLSSQAPAQPVVRLPNPDSGSTEPGNAADVKGPEPRETVRTGARARRSTPDRASGSEYLYRSVRTLSRAVIVSSALTMITVVSLAVIFVYSMNMSQERLMAMSRETGEAYRARDEAERNVLQARLERQDEAKQSNDEKAKLKQENAGLKQAYAELKQANAKTEEELAKARLEVLPAKLNNRESKDINNALTAFLLKTKSRNAKPDLVAHKSDVAALQQRVRKGEDRRLIHQEYTRLISKVDKQTKVEMEDKVGKVLMGD